MNKHDQVPEVSKREAQDERSNTRRIYNVDSLTRMSVQFRDGDAFGTFCVILSHDRVPFELAGFQTVILTQEHLQHLPYDSDEAYRKYWEEERISAIERVPHASESVRRYLPSEEETEQILKELAEGF